MQIQKQTRGEPVRIGAVAAIGPEVSDVRVYSDGHGWYVEEVVLVPIRVTRQIETNVSLPVARAAAEAWRDRSGGVMRGIP